MATKLLNSKCIWLLLFYIAGRTHSQSRSWALNAIEDRTPASMPKTPSDKHPLIKLSYFTTSCNHQLRASSYTPLGFQSPMHALLSLFIRMYITTTRYCVPDRILVYLFLIPEYSNLSVPTHNPRCEGCQRNACLFQALPIPPYASHAKPVVNVCVLYHSYTPTGFQSLPLFPSFPSLPPMLCALRHCLPHIYLSAIPSTASS